MQYLSFLLVMLFLAGCAGTKTKVDCGTEMVDCKSTIVSKKTSGKGIESGVLYAIPHQLLEFSLVRETITLEKLKNATEKARKDAENAQEKVDVKGDTISLLQNSLKDAPAGEAKAKLGLELEIALLQQIALKGELAEATKNLWEAEKNVKAYKKDSQHDTIKITALPPVPDANNRFVAQINRGPFNAETVEIKTTEEGLLSGGSGTSEGQIDEIFVELVNAIAATTGISKSTNKKITVKKANESAISQPDVCTTDDMTFKLVFDLHDPSFSKKLDNSLKSNHLCYKVRLASDNPAGTDEPSDFYKNGLVYPRKIAVQFDIYKLEKEAGQDKENLENSLFLTVIDSHLLGVIPFERGYFATNEYEFEFKSGLLTRYKAVTPNELLSIFGMFPRAAKAIVSVPADIIKLKLDYSSSEESYYKAQQAAFEARQAYEKAVAEQPTIEKNE